MTRTAHEVTDAELAVLQALWEHGRSPIRVLTDWVYPGGGTSHYATVQKLLERLEAKGFVARDRSRSVHVFAATVGRGELIERRLRSLAEQLCGGSLAQLLTHLLGARQLSADEREALRALANPSDDPAPAPRRQSRTARAAKVALAATALLLLPHVPRLAAKDAPPPTTQPAATAPGESKENKAERPRAERKPERPIWGTISKVDDGALYLLIGDAKREVIVPVQPETEVFIAGRKASITDLGPEWSVNIIQEQGLTKTINAKPPRPKPPVKKTDGGKPAATEKQP